MPASRRAAGTRPSGLAGWANRPALVLRMASRGIRLLSDDGERVLVEAEAGEPWHPFVQWTLAQGFAGLENLSLIPGTVGAAPVQNIGAYGVELKDLFVGLTALNRHTGELREFALDECGFAYRDSLFKRESGRWLILRVRFALNRSAALHLDYGPVRQRLAELPRVDVAQLDLVWVERLAAILKLGDRFVFGLAVMLISALLLVIGNTIRLHIENRRTEIEVIKLVGGTDAYVRRPFLYMGALYGLGAGLLAWGILAFGLNWLNEAVVGLSGLYGSDFALGGVPASDGLSLLIGAVLLGYIGAWIAVARHLNELAPR